jgi:hypothetical protein
MGFFFAPWFLYIGGYYTNLPLFHNWWLLLQYIDNPTGTPIFNIDIDNLINKQKAFYFLKKNLPDSYEKK